MASLQLQKSYSDYCIACRKLSELCLEMRVCRGSDIGSGHLLTLAKLRFAPKWLHLPKNIARNENILHYKIILLSDESIRWLYKQRILQYRQKVFPTILFYIAKGNEHFGYSLDIPYIR